MKAPLPANEAERLSALKDYEILDTDPEESFDEITSLAADITGCPVATISLIDHDRQWYKSRIGLTATETRRDDAFCAHTILETKLVLVPDATKDPRFADNPYVLGEPKIRFYAGLPLITTDGYALGTLCVIDTKPRGLTPQQRHALDSLGHHIVTHLELRRALAARRRAEEEVRRLNNELEARVEERTRQLNEVNRVLQEEMSERERLQRQMVQIQKMEAIGRLAGGIAHDFNNLLLVINGYCDLLLGKEGITGPLRAYAEEIQKGGLRGAALTRQLLAFTRQQVIEPRVLNLNAVLENMLGMLLRLVGASIIFKFEPGPDLPSIHGDPSQIEQVIMNLVINACDAMGNGGRLTLKTEALLLENSRTISGVEIEPNFYTVLHVEDSGAGMTEEVKARLFEPFFTTKATGRGTGLGLATCYGIVKQSGGFIVCESEVGRGTTFHVYLPALETDKPAYTSMPLPPIIRGHETILLVEDDRTVRELTATLLRGFGYTVHEAQDGLEAVALVESRPSLHFDLVISDIVMPNMNGREVVERVTRLRPGTPALLLSGHTNDEVVHQEVLQAHASFLQKPFRANHLAQAVRDALGRPKEKA